MRLKIVPSLDLQFSGRGKSTFFRNLRQYCNRHIMVARIRGKISLYASYTLISKVLSGGFSIGWAKAGMTIVRDPDHKVMIGTHYPSPLHILKGFGLGPLMAEI